MQNLYNSCVISNESPVALQWKVYFETSLHFYAKGEQEFYSSRNPPLKLEQMTKASGMQSKTMQNLNKNKCNDKNAAIKE